MIRRGYIARTWAVPKELAQEIKDIATELQVPDSQIVVRLLRYSLAELDAGRIVFETRITARELVEA